MAAQRHCLVVGAGINGMLTALELADAGLRVTLLERREVGRESSWAGGGILSPLYPWRYPPAVSRLAAWGQGRYPELASRLAKASGVDPEWERSGLLILDTEEAPAAQAWAAEQGAVVATLRSEAVSGWEPGLGGAPDAALSLPQVAQIRNPRLLKALRRVLVSLGVTILEQAEVQGLDVVGSRVRGVHTATGPVAGEQVVVAAGAWTGPLLGDRMAEVRVEPVRGQMILFRGQPGTVRRIVLRKGYYLVPRRDGRVLAGSTLEFVGFDKRTTEEARATLREAALTLIPALADAPVERHWAGLRPGSPNGVPYIGAHTEIRGLYVNAGQFRNGVVLAPASARLMADIVLERSPILDPADYALELPREGDFRT